MKTITKNKIIYILGTALSITLFFIIDRNYVKTSHILKILNAALFISLFFSITYHWGKTLKQEQSQEVVKQ